MDQLGSYGSINRIESQTYEDPMRLAMNLYETEEENRAYLSDLGLDDKTVDHVFDYYAPLGACSSYILEDIRRFTGGKTEDMKKFLSIVPVPLSETLGTVTGKYPAKDKITSSSVDLLGEESIQRLLHISDTNNPYRFDLRRGALARVAGGGIHFSDEIFKNKRGPGADLPGGHPEQNHRAGRLQVAHRHSGHRHQQQCRVQQIPGREGGGSHRGSLADSVM